MSRSIPLPDWLPGEKEEIPKQDGVTRTLQDETKVYGCLWLTNWRLIFRSSDSEIPSGNWLRQTLGKIVHKLTHLCHPPTQIDPSIRDFEVPVISIKSIKKHKPTEVVGTKAKSYIKVVSHDFQSLHFHFPMNSGGTKRTLGAIEKLLSHYNTLSDCFAFTSGEIWEPMARVFDICWVAGLPSTEFERKGVFDAEFRRSDLNSTFKAVPVYPPELPVPNSLADGQIEASINAREGGQFPVVTWRSASGMLLLRGLSQTQEKTPDEDLVLVRILSLKAPNKMLKIFDIGPKRTMTYSSNYKMYYPDHLELPTHYNVEAAFNEFFDSLSTYGKDPGITSIPSSWHNILVKYMEQVSAMSQLLDSGFSLLIQGGRRNMNHVALLTLIQIVSDPSYRTIRGLCILLEKDWFQFSFPFRDSSCCFAFELALHLLWMVTQAYPAHFEFDERLLSFILDQMYSGRFVNFVFPSRRELERYRTRLASLSPPIPAHTVSIWGYIQCKQSEFRSVMYNPALIPSTCDFENELQSLPSAQQQQANGGIMIGSSVGTGIVSSGALDTGPTLVQIHGGQQLTSSGRTPHLISVDRLATLPVVWASRFMRHDCSSKRTFVKAEQHAKPGAAMSIYSLPNTLCQLYSLPSKIFSLPNLTILHIKRSMLTVVPLEIAFIASLEEISLQGNPIRVLPEDWLQLMGSNLTKLRLLDVSKTYINTITLAIHKYIPSLQKFKAGALERFSPNPLTLLPSIPAWPPEAQLDTIDLSSNGLIVLPPRFVNMVQISVLDLSGNQFTNIPLQVECLTKLTQLHISDNKMSILTPPSGGYRMEVLSILNLSGNGLETFPDHIGNLPALKHLSLAKNNLSELSIRFFMQFKHLDILNLSQNKISSLPPSIGNMVKLTYFDLSNNHLTIIPDSILGMTNLKVLDLSDNKLPSLAVCFGRMKTLTSLKINNNAMSVLPPQLGSLRDSLHTFEFDGNDLVTPPLDIVKGGSKAVLDFLYDSLSGSKPVYRMKLMIVGEENVGKTTLVDQLTRRWKAGTAESVFEPITTLSTDGVMISQCSFRWKNEGDQKIAKLADEFDVNISWWDFAGQELYYTTHQFFLSGRSLFLVAWNLEKPMTDSRVEFWLNSIQSKISNATVVLIGTHLDSLKPPAREAVNDSLKQHKFRLRTLFPTLEISVFLVGARSGEGMNDLKEILEKKIVASKHMGELLPASYMLLEKMVVDARATSTIPVISKHKFLEMSLMCNISGEKELFRASSLLHNLGTMIYFCEDLVLSRYVVLDPQWLAKLMCTLITTKHSFVSAGLIPHRALGQIWREYPLAMYGFLLGLLEKFEVTYNLTGFLDPSFTPTRNLQFQLLPFAERVKPASKKSKDRKEKGSVDSEGRSSSSSSSNNPAVLVKEWLRALIPMMKRHQTIIIGNTPMRRQTAVNVHQIRKTIDHMEQSQSTPIVENGFKTTANLSHSKIKTSILPGNSLFESPTGVRPTSMRLTPNPNAPLLSIQASLNLSNTGPMSPESSTKPNVTKILDRDREAVGIFDLDGVSLIPSMLPTVAPACIEAKNMWPESPPPGETDVTRDYLFDFIPEGLVSRLTVRLLQRFLDMTNELVLWREGILLLRSDSTVFVRLMQRGDFQVLRIQVRGSNFLDVGRVFSTIIEANGILFKEWSRLRISLEAPCPHCLSARIPTPTYFPLEIILDAVRQDLDALECSLTYSATPDTPEHTQVTRIPLEKAAPDFRLIYLKGNQIQFSELVLEKQIGVGGFAVVYKGNYKSQTIAVKQLSIGNKEEANPDVDKAPTPIDMDTMSSEEYNKAFAEFRKEAFMLTDIVDQHCVRMTGVCFKPFCLITEFVPCGDLYSLCHRDPLKEISWDLRLRIALDMAKGMNFLHSLKPPIIHNDLKSPNVLLASMDPNAPVVAKISDFGLSMRMSKMYTRMVDNPVWIAPEIMRGHTYDTKADVYAYGVMLWEMIERRGFFSDVVFNSELEKKVMAGERPPILANVLPEYEKLIKACWDNDPLRRPTFENVVFLLEQLIDAFQKGLTKVGLSVEMQLPEAQRGRRAQVEKPAFIQYKTQAPSSNPSSDSSSPKDSPPEPTNKIAPIPVAKVAPPPPVIQEDVPPAAEFDPKSLQSTKIRLNVLGTGKAPSRAEVAARGNERNESTGESAGGVSPRSPKLVEPVVQQQSVQNQLPTSSSPKDQPSKSYHGQKSVTQEKLQALLNRKQTPSPATDASTSTTISYPTSISSNNAPTNASNTTNKLQFRQGNRVLSVKTALQGSMANIMSSLQSLQNASSNVEDLLSEIDNFESDFVRQTEGLEISQQVSQNSGKSASSNGNGAAPNPASFNPHNVTNNLKPIPPRNTAEEARFATQDQANSSQGNQPSSSSTLLLIRSQPTAQSAQQPQQSVVPSSTVAPKPTLIGLEDAKSRLSDLSDGLKTILKFVVSITSSVKNGDMTSCQAMVLDLIRFLKPFREAAGIACGLKTYNQTINASIAALTNNMRTTLNDTLNLLQVARAILKQDAAVTSTEFGTAASTFVSSYKSTIATLGNVLLEGQNVLEIHQVDFANSAAS